MNSTRTRWSAPPEQQRAAVEALFTHAILSEWVGVRDEDSRQWLHEEDGTPLDELKIPYYSESGEPITRSEPQ